MVGLPQDIIVPPSGLPQPWKDRRAAQNRLVGNRFHVPSILLELMWFFGAAQGQATEMLARRYPLDEALLRRKASDTVLWLAWLRVPEHPYCVCRGL